MHSVKFMSGHWGKRDGDRSVLAVWSVTVILSCL